MIDTDKYKGHTPAPWKALLNHPQVDGSCVVSDEDESNFGYTDGERILGPLWVGELTDDMPDTKLIADAPLLLAEVKRLQKRSKKLENALLTLADGAGDVPMFNKGGEAYEALWGDEE